MIRVLAGATLISFSAVFVALSGVASAPAAFYRVFIGGIVLLLFAALRREHLRINARLIGFVLLAALTFALDLVLWHLSIYRVGPGIATLFPNFQVLLMAVGGVLLWRERISLGTALGISFALAGLILLLAAAPGAEHVRFLAGVGYGLGAAVAYTGYLLCLRAAGGSASQHAPALFMALVSLATAVVVALWLTARGGGFAVAFGSAWLWLALYGLGCQAGGWFLISTGLPRVPAATGGVLLLLQPVLTFAWDKLIFHRQFTALEIAGAVLALSSIFWVRLRQSRDQVRGLVRTKGS